MTVSCLTKLRLLWVATDSDFKTTCIASLVLIGRAVLGLDFEKTDDPPKADFVLMFFKKEKVSVNVDTQKPYKSMVATSMVDSMFSAPKKSIF